MLSLTCIQKTYRTFYQTKLCESAKQVALKKTERVIIRSNYIYLYKILHNVSIKIQLSNDYRYIIIRISLI